MGAVHRSNNLSIGDDRGKLEQSLWAKLDDLIEHLTSIASAGNLGEEGSDILLTLWRRKSSLVDKRISLFPEFKVGSHSPYYLSSALLDDQQLNRLRSVLPEELLPLLSEIGQLDQMLRQS